MKYIIKHCLILSLMLFGVNTASIAQGDINAMEYFIDDQDLGVGANPTIPISGGALITESFTIPTSGLSVGFHTVYFRVQDLGGQWSVSDSRSFYISASNLTAQANIVDVEYYIDNDLGVGAGTSLGPLSSTTVNLTPTIPTSGLSAGFHTINTRALDSDGTWGDLESRSFYVSPSDLTTTANIVEVRYYVDIDPGFGNGTLIPITIAPNINTITTANTSTLPAGHHTLHVRLLDSDGVWSEIESRSFYIDAFSAGLITGIEYFYNIDPGYGAGDIFPIAPPVASIDQVIDLLTTGLTAGTHELGIRLINDNGVIGMTDYYTFDLCATAAPNFLPDVVCAGNITTFTDNSTGVIGGDIYSWDFDADGFEDSNTSGIQSFTYPTDGMFTASLTIDRAGCISSTSIAVTVGSVPIAGFTASITCLGLATSLIDISTGTLAGDVYSWDFDGDGFEDSNTSGFQSFTYPTEGTFTTSLTIDRAGCISTTQVMVTVAATPISDAGVDLIFCEDNTTLSANVPGTGETGLWSLISGSGIFTNTSDPNTTFTGITSATSQLRWTVTNTLSGCSTFDDVVLMSNLAIFTVDQTTTVDIGQSIILDVQSSAVINVGDVLTTTITTDPVSGIATVQANGTIEYSPNEDASGIDALVFRITNQCGNFDERSIQITIVNQAPVIDAQGFTGIPNATQLVFDLTTLISDPNNNLDFTSLRLVTQPLSGAVATIDANGVLTIDYSGVTFSGDDQIDIEICDLVGVCTVQTIIIPNVDVGGEDPPIAVFNAVSPNGDDKHDFLEIENIESYPGNQVVIFNRWGDVVYEVTNYNNTDNNFFGQTDGGNNLPSGTYYYSVDLNNGSTVVTGFIMLNK